MKKLLPGRVSFHSKRRGQQTIEGVANNVSTGERSELSKFKNRHSLLQSSLQKIQQPEGGLALPPISPTKSPPCSKSAINCTGCSAMLTSAMSTQKCETCCKLFCEQCIWNTTPSSSPRRLTRRIATESESESQSIFCRECARANRSLRRKSSFSKQQTLHRQDFCNKIEWDRLDHIFWLQGCVENGSDQL